MPGADLLLPVIPASARLCLESVFLVALVQLTLTEDYMAKAVAQLQLIRPPAMPGNQSGYVWTGGTVCRAATALHKAYCWSAPSQFSSWSDLALPGTDNINGTAISSGYLVRGLNVVVVNTYTFPLSCGDAIGKRHTCTCGS